MYRTITYSNKLFYLEGGGDMSLHCSLFDGKKFGNNAELTFVNHVRMNNYLECSIILSMYVHLNTMKNVSLLYSKTRETHSKHTVRLLRTLLNEQNTY